MRAGGQEPACRHLMTGDLTEIGSPTDRSKDRGIAMTAEATQEHGGTQVTIPQFMRPGGDLECSPHNPLRPLDWRWRRASLGKVPTNRRGRRIDDSWVRRARRHLAALAPRPEARRRRRSPLAAAIDAARALRSPVGIETRDELEARLLAGQDDVTVAARCGLDPGVVAAYEALFFEVRAYLDCTDAVLILAIGPRLVDPDGGGRWAAYFGGPVMVDALLGRRGDPDAPADDVGPDPEAVRAFELLVKVAALDAGRVGVLKLERLRRHADRVAAMTPVGTITRTRTVPRPDLAALREAVDGPVAPAAPSAVQPGAAE